MPTRRPSPVIAAGAALLTLAIALILPVAGPAQAQQTEQAPTADDSSPAGANTASQTPPPPGAEASPPAGFPEPTASTRHELVALAKQFLALRAKLDSTDAASEPEAIRATDALARDAASLAKLLPAPPDRLSARHLEMQAYHALARRAQLSRQERESSFRVSQLRSAALATRDLGAALGEPLADYWLLQADLFDLQRLDATPHARQRRMAQRLERFVEEQARAAQLTDDKDDPTLRSLIQRLLLDAQRVLLRLADDRGDSGRASELLKEITESPAITPLESSELSDRHAGLALLGRRFDAELQLADGRTWLASERRGKTLVLLFIAQGHEASDEAAQRLLTLEPSLRVRGVEVLTVRVSTPRPAQHDQASPQIPPARLYVEQDQPVLLSRVFAVRSLPRYVVIDPKGKIKSMGASEAVISDLAAPAAPHEPATPPRAAPQPPPLPRTAPTDNDKPTQP